MSRQSFVCAVLAPERLLTLPLCLCHDDRSSASDMDLSGGSDVETKPMQSKAPDSGDDSDDAAEQGEVRPDLFPYEGIYKNSEDKAR